MLTVTNSSKVDWENLSLLQTMEGNAMDTYFTLKLYEYFMEELADPEVKKLYDHLIAPVTPYFIEAEHCGMRVSEQELDKLDKQLRFLIMQVEDEIYQLDNVLPTDNLKANATHGRILFAKKDKDGYDYQENSFNLLPTKLTETGSASVAEGPLNLLLEFINKELLER